MTIDDRIRIFGEPTDSLVAEAVYVFREDHDRWPLLAELREVWTGQELDDAIRNGEVAVTVDDLVSLTKEMEDKIARLDIDLNMPRKGEAPCGS